MSGVEIAGLVLGVLPLLIQGIESYNEGLDPIKSFMRWERELPQFIRKLRNQHVHYAQTIRILFEPITVEEELAQMMTEPGSQELWKSKELALQNKLQESYQAYQSTIGNIERITKKIASKLDLDRATELSRNDLEALIAANPKKNDKFELRKRIRFGMNKKTIKALLEELDDCNKELERFTDKSEKIETYRKSVKPSTSLQLEPRHGLFATGLKKTITPSKTSFNVSFSTVSADKNDAPWLWQAAEICVEDEEETLKPISSPKPKMTKSVSFGTPPPYSVLDPATDLKSSLQDINDLCASIQQLHKSSPIIGFSFGSKSKLRGTYSIDAADVYVPPAETVTLEDLLDHPPVINGRRSRLSKRERYSLALTLASSVLYLNSTPWLTDQWAAKDILFHRTAIASRPIDTEHPYVAPALIELSKVLPNGQKPRGFHNKNTVLLALAIALLELYFGTTAEKYQESEHGAADPSFHQNPWMLCSMAHTWAEESQEDLSAAFLSAVRHCLRCFSDPGASLQDAEFLQAAVEGIVLPLQEELYQFLGKTAT
ncbi:Nn.00g068870.m01.CDS01 [Neocucurbitaria sp. VM-36]